MTEEQWNILAGRAGAVLNYGIEDKAWLKQSKIARLITAIPFLAGCDKAEETAFSHLLIYLIALHESGKSIFLHKPIDDRDVYTRLFPLSNFMGGDVSVISCGLDLIALTMIAGYRRDAGEDEKLGKYNPLNAGKWDYATESDKLTGKIKASITPEMEVLYTVEDALKGYWKS